jgi:hypothetical protein
MGVVHQLAGLGQSVLYGTLAIPLQRFNPYVYGDCSSSVYTNVSNTYGSFCCSATRNAWQGMNWDSGGWLNYGAWTANEV